MNEDFTNILNNFSDILKEKNIDLNNLMGGENPPNHHEDNNDNSNHHDDFSFDINTIMKIKELMNSMNNKNGPRNQLLYSLKPYLEDTKKEKLEQYIKIANLLSVLDSLDDKNSFSFLNSFKFLKDSEYDFVLMLILFLLIL